jgi:hypothetical protein
MNALTQHMQELAKAMYAAHLEALREQGFIVFIPPDKTVPPGTVFH